MHVLTTTTTSTQVDGRSDLVAIAGGFRGGEDSDEEEEEKKKQRRHCSGTRHGVRPTDSYDAVGAARYVYISTAKL